MVSGEIIGSRVADGEIVGSEVVGGEMVGGERVGGRVAGNVIVGIEVAGSDIFGSGIVPGEIVGGRVRRKARILDVGGIGCRERGGGRVGGRTVGDRVVLGWILAGEVEAGARGRGSGLPINAAPVSLVTMAMSGWRRRRGHTHLQTLTSQLSQYVALAIAQSFSQESGALQPVRSTHLQGG